jgi:signal transduction histidine kinase
VRRIEILKTTSFRIALFYAGLFMGSVLILFSIIYLATAGYATRQVQSAVINDLSALQAEYVIGGRNSVIADIIGRVAATESGDRSSFFLLQAPDGTPIAGNIGPRPRQTGRLEFTATYTIGNRTRQGHVLAAGAILPDGSYLLVARGAILLDELTREITQAFTWGIAATLILAALGAVLMSSVSLRRVEAINASTREIVAGDLGRRLPTRGTNDEFDNLAIQVNHMLDRIQTLMSGLQQVSNDIAHDLKTPMTRLRQQLELVRHRATSVAEYQEAVDRAITECDLTLGTFNALLRIAQIEAGTRREGFRVFDLALVARNLLETYQPVAEESGYELSGIIAPSARIFGDAELITQLIANLLENALKHTPSGTHIALEIAALPDAYELSVSDTGPGIPESERDKVFQRFYRLDSSRSTAGSGLGLSLVAAIAQLHDVRIILSNNDPGLKVAMRFPAAQ